MNLVFCRGCGEKIHETAQTCPHCGYQYTSLSDNKKNMWMAVVSSLLALICLTNWPGFERWNTNEMVGVLFLAICSLVIGTISLARGYKGKVASWVSAVVSTISIFLVFGVM